MLWAAASLAAGIALGSVVSTPAPLLAAAATAFATAAILFAVRTVGPEQTRHAIVRSLAAFAFAMLALACAGVIGIRARAAATPSLGELASWSDGREVTIIGRVVREGTLRQQARYSHQSVDVETEQVSDGETFVRTTKRLRVSIYDSRSGRATVPELRYGERVRLVAKMREPRNFGNPGSWDYRGYLLTQGVVALASARADRIERLDGFAGSRLIAWQLAARRAITRRIAALWPGEQGALLSAMLIGDRSEIGRATDDAWQRSGVYHVLVVSGMNVGLLALAVFWILQLVRAPQWLATLATVLLAAAYAFLADLGAPIVRATLMIAVYLVARLLYRDRSVLNGLGASALAILAFDPHVLFEPSFQLTFLAVATIAGIAVPLIERTSWRYSRALRHLRSVAIDPGLQPRVAQFRLELRMLSDRVSRILGWIPYVSHDLRRRIADTVCTTTCATLFRSYELVVVSALMQVALALPMAIYFHRAPLASLPANLLATPVTSVLMISAAAALCLDTVSSALAAIPAAIASMALGWMNAVVAYFGTLDIANVRVPQLSFAVSVGSAAALALAVTLSRTRRKIVLGTLAALAISAAAITSYTPPPSLRAGVLEVTAIDVGQADSLFVATPGGKTLLVDAAGSLGGSSEFDYGEEVVSPYLWARGISRLDAVALTHAHSDHMGGMRAVITNFRPKELWVPASLASTNYHPAADLMAFAREKGVTIRALCPGDTIFFGGAEVRVLAPQSPTCGNDAQGAQRAAITPRNEDSLVVKVSYGATSALLTGDADGTAERTIIDADPQADVLKVAHNGSKVSTSPELLSAVRPGFAVISVGARNSYGHPRPEVLQRLADARARVYRTDRDGAVTFVLDGTRVTPVPWDR